MPAIPPQAVLLLSGVPATGKSFFGEYLAREHGFAHYNFDGYDEWGAQFTDVRADAAAFLGETRRLDPRIVLEYGFPPREVTVIRNLQRAGARLVWFDGDRARAREALIERATVPIEAWNIQMPAIEAANYPDSLGCEVVIALTDTGARVAPEEIAEQLFPSR